MTVLIVLVIILVCYYVLSLSESFSFSNRLINYYIKKSNIHGSGIFLKKNVKEGEYLFKAITDKMHIHYVSGKTTKCRCKVANKINHELRRAKAVIEKKN